MTELLFTNLLSPITLCFVLGVIAKVIGSDLSLPKDIYAGVSIFLILALGLKGGVELINAPADSILLPVLATLALGVITPISSFLVLRFIGKFGISDSAAIAAHYGSVSAVTFIAAQNFVIGLGVSDPTIPQLEGFMSTLLAILESPGLLIALAIGASRPGSSSAQVLHEIVTGKTIVLLIGGLVIGAAIGDKNWNSISPFFDPKGAMFKGMLCLFLLEMGIVAGSRLRDLKKAGLRLLAFGTVIPVAHGALAVVLGSMAGLSISGCTVLAAMAASASYIAAPPAVRITLPEANPCYYLTAALAITFPFNIVIGIPLYFEIAKWVAY